MLRIFYKPPVAAFVSTGMGRRRKRGTKERGKIFQIKEEKENISVNFYLQFAVLNKTEMQIQLCKYCGAAHPFFLTFSSNPLSCDSCVFIFLYFHSWQTEKDLLLHFIRTFRSRHWELFRKTPVDFFHKIGVILQYSVLNKKVYKYIKSEILRRYYFRFMVKKKIWQSYTKTTFLAQFWMAASDHLLNELVRSKIRHVKN